MTNKMNTCARCPQLGKSKVIHFTTYYCKATPEQLIVPSLVESTPKGSKATFTRVPEFCPRTDTNISTKPAKKSLHEIIQEP